MAILGFIFLFLLMCYFTFWLVGCVWLQAGFSGIFSTTEKIVYSGLAIMNVYLWVLLINSSPFTVVVS